MNERLASPWRWVAVAVYFVATSLGHLRFTQWLLQPRESTWLGEFAVKDAVPALLVAAGIGLALWIARTGLRDPPAARVVLAYWGLWAVCVAVVDRMLTYSVYEYAHYPQYALLAWLIARALDPARTGQHRGRVLFWATLLGMADELMQYLWITPSYGNYLDFNDFLVNLLGAAAGEMLHSAQRGGHRRAGAAHWRRHAVEWGTVLVLGSCIAFGALTQRLQVSPPAGQEVPSGGWSTGADGVARLYLQRAPGWYLSRQISPHRGAYWVLSPGFGTLLILVLGWTFAYRPVRNLPAPAGA